MPQVDLQALQATVAAIQGLVDADPNTPGFQVGQNIVAQLVALGNRINTLEASTVVAQLQALANSINTALAAEVVARQEGDAALQANIDALSAQYDSLSQQVTSIINNPGGGGDTCDCEAISAQLLALETTVGNLTGTDAAQAAQIATLQAQVAALSAGLATATATANAAAAAAASATATANAAAAATAALSVVVGDLDNTHNGHHNQHRGRLNSLETFQSGVEAINCTALLAKHALGLAAGRAA
jgi:Mrp family chromosome partitioning ATPase